MGDKVYLIVLLVIVFILLIVLVYIIKFIIDKFQVKDTSISDTNRIYDLLQQITCELDRTGCEYIMTGGTLLGAVRHGGLIPWDDDADLAILNKTPKEILEILKPLEKNNIISYEHIRGNIIIVKFRDWGTSIDIFFMAKSNPMDNGIIGDKIGDINSDKNKVYRYLPPFDLQYKKEWFTDEELYPLKAYEFGPLVLSGPNDYKNFLNRTYKGWERIASKWNHNTFVVKDVETDIFEPKLPDNNFNLHLCKLH